METSNQSVGVREDPIWYDDISVLWKHPAELIPTIRQSDTERINSMVRLVAYCSIVVAVIRRDAKYATLGAAIVAILSVCYTFGATQTKNESYANIRPTTVKKSKRICSVSTRNNPFSNATIGELARDPTRPPACTYGQDAHNEEAIRNNFNSGLFRNLDDVYEVENSRRQFITMPVTTSAPDTIAFAQFLYGNRGVTCKENSINCQPYFSSRN